MKVFVAYKLPQEHAELLRKRSLPSCIRCGGTGVKKWKSGGLQAVLCNADGCAESKTSLRAEVAADTQQVVPLPPVKRAATSAFIGLLQLIGVKSKQ